MEHDMVYHHTSRQPFCSVVFTVWNTIWYIIILPDSLSVLLCSRYGTRYGISSYFQTAFLFCCVHGMEHDMVYHHTSRQPFCSVVFTVWNTIWYIIILPDSLSVLLCSRYGTRYGISSYFQTAFLFCCVHGMEHGMVYHHTSRQPFCSVVFTVWNTIWYIIILPDSLSVLLCSRYGTYGISSYFQTAFLFCCVHGMEHGMVYHHTSRQPFCSVVFTVWNTVWYIIILPDSLSVLLCSRYGTRYGISSYFQTAFLFCCVHGMEHDMVYHHTSRQPFCSVVFTVWNTVWYIIILPDSLSVLLCSRYGTRYGISSYFQTAFLFCCVHGMEHGMVYHHTSRQPFCSVVFTVWNTIWYIIILPDSLSVLLCSRYGTRYGISSYFQTAFLFCCVHGMEHGMVYHHTSRQPFCSVVFTVWNTVWYIIILPDSLSVLLCSRTRMEHDMVYHHTSRQPFCSVVFTVWNTVWYIIILPDSLSVLLCSRYGTRYGISSYFQTAFLFCCVHGMEHGMVYHHTSRQPFCSVVFTVWNTVWYIIILPDSLSVLLCSRYGTRYGMVYHHTSRQPFCSVVFTVWNTVWYIIILPDSLSVLLCSRYGTRYGISSYFQTAFLFCCVHGMEHGMVYHHTSRQPFCSVVFTVWNTVWYIIILPDSLSVLLCSRYGTRYGISSYFQTAFLFCCVHGMEHDMVYHHTSRQPFCSVVFTVWNTVWYIIILPDSLSVLLCSRYGTRYGISSYFQTAFLFCCSCF